MRFYWPLRLSNLLCNTWPQLEPSFFYSSPHDIGFCACLHITLTFKDSEQLVFLPPPHCSHCGHGFSVSSEMSSLNPWAMYLSVSCPWGKIVPRGYMLVFLNSEKGLASLNLKSFLSLGFTIFPFVHVSSTTSSVSAPTDFSHWLPTYLTMGLWKKKDVISRYSQGWR